MWERRPTFWTLRAIPTWSESDAGQLDWVVASIHRLGLAGLENPDVEKCTHLWSQVAKNPRVNVIGHSGDPLFAYDYEKVIPLFGENHKLVEINNHSFEARKENIANCKKIALCCKRHGVPIVVDSDAHFETEWAASTRRWRCSRRSTSPRS